MSAFRWGILGCGNIARSFAKGLQAVDDAELVAVGSRTQENADAFGDEFEVARRHASYEALAADPDVDAIYISTPHVLHKENSILCLEHGKPTLCEKPFTINASDTADVVAVARERGVFLMEAMWSRFCPAMVQVREWLAAGAIGEPRLLQADFGFRAEVNPKGRLFDLALGGGGLLDVGIYCASLASMVFGPQPERIVGAANIGETGADEQAAWIQQYAGGEMALLSCAIRTSTRHEATIYGTEGDIRIPAFWHADRASLNGEETVMELAGNGYNYEAVEVMECVRAGKLESAVMPLDESVAIMDALDRIREPWGLRYPGE